MSREKQFKRDGDQEVNVEVEGQGRQRIKEDGRGEEMEVSRRDRDASKVSVL